jgi:hypothetical protein
MSHTKVKAKDSAGEIDPKPRFRTHGKPWSSAFRVVFATLRKLARSKFIDTKDKTPPDLAWDTSFARFGGFLLTFLVFVSTVSETKT